MLSVAGGGLAVGAATGPALWAIGDAVGRRSVEGAGRFVAVTPLDGIPDDGVPVSLPVVVQDPVDGWKRMPPTEVGRVWMVRRGDTVRAFSNVCPHLGCGIDYEPDSGRFLCPCHDSYFSADGEVLTGPSPRGMDDFEVRVTEGQVEVRFQRFVLGTASKRRA